MTARIAVVGSCNMDLVAFCERAPKPGETVAGERFVTAAGGKGANQAIGAARAGGSVTMIGAVGRDVFGAQLREALLAAGVDVSRLRDADTATGTAHITVDGSGDNSIIVVPGANAGVTAIDAADAEVIAAADVLLLQLEIPDAGVLAAARAAAAAGTLVVLTPAPVRPLPAELLELVDLVVANEHEAALLAGRADQDPLKALLDVVPEAIVTLGGAGSAYGTRAGAHVVTPAPRVTAVDTTAAGDAFLGAYAVARAEGRPEALKLATAAGALAVQREGASASMADRAEIEELAARL